MTTTARPTIDFSGISRETARDYASAMPSRVLDAKYHGVLKDAANGYVVDAYALNAALTAALRTGLTRFGQSTARRDFGRKVAYLGHITQAVLESHADGLPVYAQGDRSRKVESLEKVLDSHQRHIVTLDGEVAALAAAGEMAVREIGHSIEVNQSLTRDLTAAREQVRSLTAEVDENHAQAVEEGAALTEALKYTLGLLATVDPNAAFQAIGFLDAYDIEIEA